MKFMLPILILSLSITAQARLTGRALKSAISSAAKVSRPIVSEVDVMRILRKAQSKARADHVGAFEVLLNEKVPSAVLNKPGNFQVSIASQSEFAKTPKKKMEIIFDISNVDSHTRKRILSAIKDPNWSNVGHFETSIKQLNTTEDDLFVRLEVSGVNTMDLNNLRGISRVVNDTFKIGLENQSVRAIKTRPLEFAPNGAR